MIKTEYNVRVPVKDESIVAEVLGSAGFHAIHASPLIDESTRFGHRDAPGMVAYCHRDGHIQVSHHGCSASRRVLDSLYALVA
jgi:hypothetical protein